MRIRIGSPFLLTIISIFSILFFATSIAAQQASDMPPIGSSSGMPPVGGQSPAQKALALAQAAKLAADQQVTTAQGTFESAQSAVQTAQQTLTTAQETLVSATSALQEAERAVEDETQQKAELIRVAEQAVQQAEQNLQTAQQELDSARSALQELEQQIATAQGTVTTAESKQQELNTLLLQAQAEVARLMGNSSGMPPMGNSSGLPPSDGGNDQLTQELPLTDTDPIALVASRIEQLPVTRWYTASHPVGSHMIELTEKCAEAVDVGDSIDVGVWGRATAQTSNPSCTRLFDIWKIVVNQSEGNDKIERFIDRVVRPQSRPQPTPQRRYDLAYAGLLQLLGPLRR